MGGWGHPGAPRSQGGAEGGNVAGGGSSGARGERPKRWTEAEMIRHEAARRAARVERRQRVERQRGGNGAPPPGGVEQGSKPEMPLQRESGGTRATSRHRHRQRNDRDLGGPVGATPTPALKK